ncbi:MAG: hypothetical protein QF718_03805 [Phycisphaerales bacterium]|nr:hypothetical protein [Phycisphaerales bacterium]
MKTRSMLGLGLVSSLLCGTAASGEFAFQGIDYRIAETNAVAGDFNWTVEFYLVLNSDERLDAVAGDGVNDKRLATNGTFYQNPFGGPTSMEINPLLYGNFPSLQYDSFVTVGAMDSTGYPYTNNALMNIGIDWSNFEDNGGDVYTDNGLWFVTPDDDQGQPMLFTNQNCEDKYGVLIARVTVFDPFQDANVYIGALFQGKDNTGTTWQATGNIEVFYPTITDCNNNGVDDTCDITNGTSFDDNDNGIPDECEFPDCNGNGIDDGQDIADGTSDDCNMNGTPDECETDNDCNENGVPDDCETFDDCNGNGIPDECEIFNDCNENGVPDECEDYLTDWNNNGVPDICEDLAAYNIETSVGYESLSSANIDADEGDVILVQFSHVNDIDSIVHTKGLDNNCDGQPEPGHQCQGGHLCSCGCINNADLSISLHDGSSFNSLNAVNVGQVRSGTSGTARVTSGDSIEVATALAYRGASLDFSGTTVSILDATLRRDSEMGINGDAHATGTWTCSAGSVVYADLNIDGNLRGTTDIMGDTTVNGEMRATDDILVGANLTNNGLVAMHRGVLYVFGDLTNNGTILGEVDGGPGVRGGDGGPAAGDGMRVEGNYNVGEDASIFLPHENWRLAVGGNFNVEIIDNAQFDMSIATLDMVAHTGQDPVTMEALSADLGNTEEGLDPNTSCALPIGTIQISGGATVEVVDGKDNDCDGSIADVMYTQNLVVKAGGELRTNGYIIYTSNLDNQGTIIGEDDIIIINPPIPGDLDGDGVVGILDILIVIADWGPCPDGCTGDVNEDGVSDILDLLVIIANWS